MTTAEEPSGGRSIRAATAVIASGTIVSRILGFVSGVVAAQTIDTVGTGANTFALANQLPNNIAILLAAGLFNAVFVPAIVRAGLHDDGGARFINRLVTLGIVVFLGVGVVATLAAPLLVSLYAELGPAGDRGFSDSDIALATAFAYWCLPQVLFYALYSLLGEVLNARGVYGPFSWAPALNNIVAIGGLVAFSLIFGQGISSLSAEQWTPEMIALLGGSTTAGVAVQAFVLIFFWRRAGLRYRPDFQWRNAGLGTAGRAALWTFAMITVTQLAGIVQSNVAALSATPGEENASIAVLRMSFLIFMLPHSIAAIPITTAYFTRMSADARDGKFDSLRSDVRQSLVSIGFVIVFSALGLMVLALPFSALFAKPENVGDMAIVLVAFLVGLLPLSVHYVLRRVFFALENTRTPFFITVFQAVLFVIGAIIVAGLPADRIAVGLAVVTSLAAAAQAALALVLVRRRLGHLGGALLARRYAAFLGATLPAAGIGLLIVWALGSFSPDGFGVASLGSALVTLVVAGSAMAAVYGGILLAVRNPEAVSFARPVLSRLRRRG